VVSFLVTKTAWDPRGGPVRSSRLKALLPLSQQCGKLPEMEAFAEIAVFVRVAQALSFTRAARALGLTASGVSRAISRLEGKLGVRLLNRTTRSISLTFDGASYYARCARILSELEEANLTLSRARRTPAGRVRVDAPTVLARYVIGPALPAFLEKYSELSVDLSVHDELIDPVAEGVDVVLRMTELRESELIAKKLGSMRVVLVGSPQYFADHGRPREPAELRSHRTVGFLSGGSPLAWRFQGAKGELSLAVTGRLHSNSADALRRAALAGLGLIQVFEAHVLDELKSGALELALTEHEPKARAIFALYARQEPTPPKVRVLLDFLAERLASRQAPPAPTGG
jgi:DNA-binding transcriptional LysR family regulator